MIDLIHEKYLSIWVRKEAIYGRRSEHHRDRQTGIYSQVDKTVLQAKMGSTACSTE